MNYRRICLVDVRPGDDIILQCGNILRVTSVDPRSTDVICLNGYHFAHTGFSAIVGSFTDARKSTVIRIAEGQWP